MPRLPITAIVVANPLAISRPRSSRVPSAMSMK
jgi:hypothetical protein